MYTTCAWYISSKLQRVRYSVSGTVRKKVVQETALRYDDDRLDKVLPYSMTSLEWRKYPGVSPCILNVLPLWLLILIRR